MVVGEWKAPKADLSDANMLSHPVITPIEPARLRYNLIKGTYRGPETNYNITDMTPVSYPPIIQKEGKRITADLRLNLLKYHELAQRIAYLQLRKIHWKRGIVTGLFVYDLTKDLSVGDFVRYSDELLPPAPDNLYQVIGIQLRFVEGGFGNQLILKHTINWIYSPPYLTTQRPGPPFIIPGSGGDISASPHLTITDS